MERGSVLQLSTYLTLTLAAVCLGFADMFFLRWMPAFLAALGLVFYFAWRNEGRWQLSESAANSLGLVIAFGTLGWIVFQLPRSEEELISAGVPWPAGLLPHVGPLLMILTAVKLFRPKRIPDFWSLQILAVMMMTLASVLAGEFDHGIWIVLYLVCQVWCLASFYRTRPMWVHLPVEEQVRMPLFGEFEGVGAKTKARTGPLPSESASRWGGLGRAAACSITIAVLGAGLFIGIPRSGSSQWIPHKLAALSAARMSSGFDGGMDLNRTDKVELSPEIAFEATAIGSGGEACKLPTSIYWRSDTFDFYLNGRWYRAVHIAEQSGELRLQTPDDPIVLKILHPREMDAARNPQQRPANLPSDSMYLAIHVLPRMGGNLVCAEPVDIERGIGIAPMSGERPSHTAVFEYLDGTDLVMGHGRRMPLRYGQVINATQDPLRQQAGRIQAGYRSSILTQGPTEDLTAWARQLLPRIAGLSDEERTLDAGQRVPPAHHARVAQAIARHFAHSGEYLYSLNRRRVDMQLDPNLDFLANVKEGHCERYASGLTLTLRALGIPCRVVHGFHGYEPGDDGTACVRFTQAHSWVQALVPRGDGEKFDWLLLDPTPSEEAPLDRWQMLVDWFSDAIRALRSGFHSRVLEYGAFTPLTAMRQWWSKLNDYEVIFGSAIGAILAAFVGAWRWCRIPLTRWLENRIAERVQRSRAPWLAQALDLIRSATGESPGASETLLEFAGRLRTGGFGPLAAPFETIAAFANRVRFGDRTMSRTDESTIDAAVEDVRRAVLVLP